MLLDSETPLQSGRQPTPSAPSSPWELEQQLVYPSARDQVPAVGPLRSSKQPATVGAPSPGSRQAARSSARQHGETPPAGELAPATTRQTPGYRPPDPTNAAPRPPIAAANAGPMIACAKQWSGRAAACGRRCPPPPGRTPR